MSWSTAQRQMLAAMGYALPRFVPPAPAPAVFDDGSALFQALCRAAGGRDPCGLPLPPLERLRADAAAKRAAWPLLRALRRQA